MSEPTRKAVPRPRLPTRRRLRLRRVILAILGCIAIVIFCGGDYRPTPVDIAVAPYRFSIVGWELRNLPDKWLRRLAAAFTFGPAAGSQSAAEKRAAIDEYFAAGRQLRSVANRRLALESLPSLAPPEQAEQAALAQEQARLRERQSQLRPAVEETLESAVAAALESQGFRAWAGVFPPVDTVLAGSPTVLVTSPRDRIAREQDVVLQPGLTAGQRDSIEAQVEAQPNRSALVVNTGGIAFYPSITLPDAGLDFALEIIAHEWVHQWLWFHPLGRRYFQGGDITAINETVATIAGREIAALARARLAENAPPAPTPPPAGVAPAPAVPAPDANGFDFQQEMRRTRVRVDAMLAAGNVDGAEAYMEERRLALVPNGYYIRRLNQAYFAFHGAYATTGAAGISLIGQQVVELRRRSPSLGAFLRTAARITDPAELAAYLGPAPP